jgi:hypothetical protein
MNDLREKEVDVKITAAALATVCLLMLLPSRSAGQDPLPDPCGLVSQADVEQIVGKIKGQPKSSRNDPSRVCEYELADGQDVLDVWVSPARTFDRARKDLQNPTAVPEIAPEALLHRNERFEQMQLLAKKGTLAILVTLNLTPGADAKVKSIARKALSRL